MKFVKMLVAGILTGLCNGLFGAGGGMIAVYSMIHLLKMESHEAHATAIAVILPLTIISGFVYFRGGFIDWDMALKVGAAGIVGGATGAWLLGRIPPYRLRKIFGVFIIVAGLRMLF